MELGLLRITKFLLVLLISVFCMASPMSFGEVPSYSSQRLLGDFEKDWEKSWKERVLYRTANRFDVVEEEGRKVLRMVSQKSASGFWREYTIEPVTFGKISWRWRVEKSLSENTRERTKSGDDYAARVFVLFEPHFFNWRTKAVCYVWAGNQAVGSTYESPYSSSVATIVLESGNQKAGQWVHEERDFIADYKNYFGRNPIKVSAVAVMVDTDNTGFKTTTWFDDLTVVANASANLPVQIVK